jgi:hypothetical protein
MQNYAHSYIEKKLIEKKFIEKKLIEKKKKLNK